MLTFHLSESVYIYVYKGTCNDFFPMVMYICLQLVRLMKFFVESFKSIEYIHWLHLETLYSTQQGKNETIGCVIQYTIN